LRKWEEEEVGEAVGEGGEAIGVSKGRWSGNGEEILERERRMDWREDGEGGE